MIYENLLCTEQEVIDSKDINSFVEVAFLNESKELSNVKRILDDIKRTLTQIKNGAIDDEEAKEELDMLYDELKGIGDISNIANSQTILFNYLAFVIGLVIACIPMTSCQVFGAITILISSIAMACASSKSVYDKAYSLFIRVESQIQMERRKAEKAGNKDEVTNCDSLIKVIEDFKYKRRKEHAEYIKNPPQYESAILTESDKHEIDINNFKQGIAEIDRALKLSFNLLKLFCSTSLFIIKKGTTITPKNKDKVINEIIDKSDEADKEFEAREEVSNFNLINSLMKEFDKFATKYSSYGMTAREKFEKRLKEYNEEVINYLNEFYDDISVSITGEKGKSIKEVSIQLYNKIRKEVSVETADKVNHYIAYWYNDHNQIINFIMGEISWAESVMKSQKIKSTLRYKIFSKFVK